MKNKEKIVMVFDGTTEELLTNIEEVLDSKFIKKELKKHIDKESNTLNFKVSVEPVTLRLPKAKSVLTIKFQNNND